MSAFTEHELTLLRDATELRIAPFAADGSPHPGRLVWAVVADGRAYVRSWRGAGAEWYERADATRRARVTIADEGASFTRDVALHPERDSAVQAAIDAEFLRKYPRPYSVEMTLPGAAETTFELQPE